MKKILLTGNKGTIGNVLTRGLEQYELRFANLPSIDVTDYEQVLHAAKNCDVIIHLAWHMKNDIAVQQLTAYNDLMTFNIYKAALASDVSKVIMASSVHTDNFYTWDSDKGYLHTDRIPTPTTAYGRSKVFMEDSGRYYARQGLEVICVRFGGINAQNIPPLHDNFESKVWLSHNDCVTLIKKCIDAPTIPQQFTSLYAISNNTGRIHDYTNPFSWIPQDNAFTFIV